MFALSGALLATRQRLTIVTVIFFALVTGVGGGSFRDLLIGAPVFWVRDPWVAPVVLLTALLAWFTPSRWWEGRVLDWAALATANRPWLYSDDIHLRPGAGRDGYADWVLASIQP